MANTNFETLTNSMNPEIKCPSCGASFSIHANFCPYCGNANEYGQEETYMEKLESIEDNLEDMADYSEEAYADEMKRVFKKFILPILIVALALVLAFVAFGLGYKYIYVPISINRTVAAQNEAFPELDKLYEEGDFDTLQKYSDELTVKPKLKKVQVYNWKHYRFLSAYNKYTAVLEATDQIREHPADEFTRQYAMWSAVELCTLDWKQMLADKLINERDYEYIMGYQAYAAEYLRVHYGILDPMDIARKCRFDSGGEGVDFVKIKEVEKEYRWME